MSLDGEYFRQDKLTVLAGKLPALDSTNQLAVSQLMAQKFGLHPGSHLTWQFQQFEVNALGLPLPGPTGNGIERTGQRTTFVVTAIVAMPPALGDTFDDIDGAILPPAAAARYLAGPGKPWVEWSFGWVAMRLPGGDAGVPAIHRELDELATKLASAYQIGGAITFNIRRLAIVKLEAQQAIEPQAVALAILGGLIALAMLVLVGQGLAQLLSRSAADAPVLRAMGATRARSGYVTGRTGGLAIAGVGAVLSVAGAIALSPLAPDRPGARLRSAARESGPTGSCSGGGARPW